MRKSKGRTGWARVLVFLGLVGSGAPAPTGEPSSTTPRPTTGGPFSLTFASLANQEIAIGSPSELAWQAWILVDRPNRTHSERAHPVVPMLDIGYLGKSRKITPKSVFIAPDFCPEGYDKDVNGECRKPLEIDKNEQLNFLLQHLNTVYDPSQNPQHSAITSNKDKPSDPSGPFQVNIPIFSHGLKIPEIEETPLTTTQVPGRDAEETTKTDEGLTSTEAAPVADFVDENKKTSPDATDYKVIDDKETTTTKPTTTKIPPKDIAPTLVLLLAPTKTENETTLGHVILRVQNTTGNWTSKEIIASIIPLPVLNNATVPPENSTRPQDVEDTYDDDERLLPEEDLDYSTEDGVTESNDEDDFAETTDDELLKPGEAGITIPVSKTQEPEDSTSGTAPTSTENPTESSENSESNVSSEVSINDDFVLETTILDLTSTKAKNTTPETPIKAEVDALQPHVVFSAQGQNPAILEIKETTNQQQQQPGFVLRDDAIDPQASFNSKKVMPPDPKAPEAATNFRRHENLIRFPDEKQQQRLSFVRFPSDEVNSIHGLDQKPFPHDAPSSSTKSSVPTRQKPFYWQNRQQQAPYRPSLAQKQRPLLLRFWSKMPLVQDPSLYQNPGDPRFPQTRRDNSNYDHQQING